MIETKKKTISVKMATKQKCILYGLFVMLYGVADMVASIYNNEKWCIAITIVAFVGLLYRFMWDSRHKKEKGDEMSCQNMLEAIGYMTILEIAVDIIIIVIWYVLFGLLKIKLDYSVMRMASIVPDLIVIKIGFQSVLIGLFFVRLEER